MKPTMPTPIRTTPITSRLTDGDVSFTPQVRIAPMAMMSRLTMNPMSGEYPRLQFENTASSKKRKPAVDDDRLSADHLCLGRAQEGNRVGDVLSLHHAAGRRPRPRRFEHLLLVREVLERGGLDHTARDSVDPDPARRELDRQVADERLERGLGRPHEHVVLEHALRAEAGDGDDGGTARHGRNR